VTTIATAFDGRIERPEPAEKTHAATNDAASDALPRGHASLDRTRHRHEREWAFRAAVRAHSPAGDQINGCALCADMHAKALKRGGETDERLYTVATWHDAPYFSDAERAALALTEAATRMSDRADPVPDEIWEDAKRHYDEKHLAAIVIQIAAINAWNRLNVTTRQVAGGFG
jgi:alkylhydroperoxidase family enzyme